MRRTVRLRVLACLLVLGLGAIALWHRDPPAAAPSERAEPRAPEARGSASSDGGLSARDAARSIGGGCHHPLLPPAGTTLRYRLLAGADRFDYQLDVGATTEPEEEVDPSPIINLRVSMLRGAQVLISQAFTVSCDERGIGDPWLAWPERASGLDLQGAGWAWPRDLEIGDLTGLVVLARPGQDPIETIRRVHHIGPTEDVAVPAGRFSARRVDYEESRTVGDERGADDGTMWLAYGVGLVRATSEPHPGRASELVLTSIDEP